MNDNLSSMITPKNLVKVNLSRVMPLRSKGVVMAQLTKSRSENVLITSFLGYKTLDSNVMGTSIMESFLYTVLFYINVRISLILSDLTFNFAICYEI